MKQAIPDLTLEEKEKVKEATVPGLGSVLNILRNADEPERTPSTDTS
jgi:hypothetical protein